MLKRNWLLLNGRYSCLLRRNLQRDHRNKSKKEANAKHFGEYCTNERYSHTSRGIVISKSTSYTSSFPPIFIIKVHISPYFKYY